MPSIHELFEPQEGPQGLFVTVKQDKQVEYQQLIDNLKGIQQQGVDNDIIKVFKREHLNACELVITTYPTLDELDDYVDNQYHLIAADFRHRVIREELSASSSRLGDLAQLILPLLAFVNHNLKVSDRLKYKKLSTQIKGHVADWLGHTRIKVFLSYAWASEDYPEAFEQDKFYQACVEQMAVDLEKIGLAVFLDKWCDVPGREISSFIERAFEESHYIIPIGTRLYNEKFRRNKNKLPSLSIRTISEQGKKDPEHVLAFEIAIIQELSTKGQQIREKIIPVFLEEVEGKLSFPFLLDKKIPAYGNNDYFKALYGILKTAYRIDPKDFRATIPSSVPSIAVPIALPRLQSEEGPKQKELIEDITPTHIQHFMSLPLDKRVTDFLRNLFGSLSALEDGSLNQSPYYCVLDFVQTAKGLDKDSIKKIIELLVDKTNQLNSQEDESKKTYCLSAAVELASEDVFNYANSPKNLEKAITDVIVTLKKYFGDIQKVLMISVERGYLGIVRYIVNNTGSFPIGINELVDGRTALFAAAEVGYTAILKLLLDKGADTKKGYLSKGGTPLHISCKHGFVECAGLLLDNMASRGASVLEEQINLPVNGDTPLHLAANDGHLSVVKLLLNKGANPSLLNQLGTPLSMAIQHGRITDIKQQDEICCLLWEKLESMALLKKLQSREFLLEKCACNGLRRCVEKFIAVGTKIAIDSSYTDFFSQTLHEAYNDATPPEKSKEQIAILEYLISTYSIEELKKTYKKSVGNWLHVAARDGCYLLIKALLVKGLDATVVMNESFPYLPIHYLTMQPRDAVDALGLLIQAAPETVHAVESKGMTPLHYAAQYGHQKMVEMLIEHGAKVDCVNSEAETPLCCVVSNQDKVFYKKREAYLAITRILLINDAHVESRNKKGQSIIELAQKNRLEELKELLQSSKRTKDINSASIFKTEIVAPVDKLSFSSELLRAELLVNSDYQYEDEELLGILGARLGQLNLPLIFIPEHAVGTSAIALKQYLKEEQQANRKSGARTLLIPYNVGRYHWVGILVSITPQQIISEIQVLHSLEGKHYDEILTKAIREASDVYPGLKTKNVQSVKGWLQSDGTSCGPLTVENLLLAAEGKDLPARIIEAEALKAIRKAHVECYQRVDNTFADRQRNNMNRVATNQQQYQWLNQAGTGLNKYELERMEEANQLIKSIQQTATQTVLIQAFQPKADEEPKYHLDRIREVLVSLYSTASKNDSATVHQLTKVLLGIELNTATPLSLEHFDFKLPYQAIIELGDYSDKAEMVEKKPGLKQSHQNVAPQLLNATSLLQHNKEDLISVINKLLEKVEQYKADKQNSNKKPKTRVMLEIYGLALAISWKLEEKSVKVVQNKIVEAIKHFVFEDIGGSRGVVLANLGKNLNILQGSLRRIRTNAKKELSSINNASAEGLTHFLKQVEHEYKDFLNLLFEQIQGIFGKPPCKRYVLLTVGSLATQMITPYSDIEYLVLVDDHEFSADVTTYFTNFGDLFDFVMIAFSESPIYKAEKHLGEEFKNYYPYIKKGIRVDEHKKPQDLNRLFGLINTPAGLLSKLAKKIIYEQSNHLTAALLTTAYIGRSSDKSLFDKYQTLFENRLPTQEYRECLDTLLRQGLLECRGQYEALEEKLDEEKLDSQQEVKQLLVHPLHLVRELAVYLKSCGQNITLKNNPLEQLDELKEKQLLSEIDYMLWQKLITQLLSIRLELQIQSQSTEAKIELNLLDKRLKQLGETDGIKGISSKLKQITGFIENSMRVDNLSFSKNLEISQTTSPSSAIAPQTANNSLASQNQLINYARPVLFSNPIQGSANNSSTTLAEFLKLVVEGEQNLAEKMLKNNKNLALVSGDITDLSKRTFKGITALQYAVWALDWNMWEMLLNYMPVEKTYEQATAFENGSWVNQYSTHVKWDDLTDALQVLLNNWKSWNEEKINKYWIEHVGRAQLLLPVHVINEYCHPSRPLSPCPDFTKLESDREWRNRKTDAGEWFTAKYQGGSLGETFAIGRGEHGYARSHKVSKIAVWFNITAYTAYDLAGLRALYSARTKQRLDLIQSTGCKFHKIKAT